MSVLRKAYRRIENEFSDKLDSAFLEKFKTKLSTSWGIISMQRTSRRDDGKKLTSEQREWIDGFSLGYVAALDQITLKPDGSREQ